MDSKEQHMAIKKKPKICLLSTDWNNNEYRKKHNAPGGVSQYRLVHLMRALKDHYDFDYFASDFAKPEDDKRDDAQFLRDRFEKYDLVISKIIDAQYVASAVRFITQYVDVPLVVDIDDNIWEIKPDQPAYEQYSKGSTALGVASTYVSMADAVFSSTEPLAEYVSTRMKEVYKEEKPVYVLPNYIDPADYPFEKAPSRKDKIIIGWQGSVTHHEDLKLVMPAINKLLIEFPQLHLELLGGVPKEMAGDLFSGIDDKVIHKIMSIGGVPAFDKFPKLLSEQDWDIGIAPITDDLFNRAKSHIKWLEYAMFSIPCVASDVHPYKVIEDGKTGYLSKPDEWYNKLKLLITNEELRKEIGENAHKEVMEKWTIDNSVEKYKEVIDKLIESRE